MVGKVGWGKLRGGNPGEGVWEGEEFGFSADTVGSDISLEKGGLAC